MSKSNPEQEKEIQELKKLIQKSGFPLETEIATSIENIFGHKLLNSPTNSYYLDKDEKKGIEIDINYTLSAEPKNLDSPLSFIHNLIECKNIPGNAWVFFKTNQEIWSHLPTLNILDALKWRKRSGFVDIQKLHFRNVPKTKQYKEFIVDKKKSNNKKNNLYSSIIKVTKAANYEYEKYLKEFKRAVREDDILTFDFINIFYATIVCNGKMYLADHLHKGTEMQLKPIEHVVLSNDYLSGNYEMKLVIDIVQKNYFEEYSKMILEDLEVLINEAENEEGKKYIEEVVEASKWLAKKRSNTGIDFL